MYVIRLSEKISLDSAGSPRHFEFVRSVKNHSQIGRYIVFDHEEDTAVEEAFGDLSLHSLSIKVSQAVWSLHTRILPLTNLVNPRGSFLFDDLF